MTSTAPENVVNPRSVKPFMCSSSYPTLPNAPPRARRRCPSCWFIAGAWLAANLVACGSEGSPCASSCESNLWPRAIVGVLDRPDRFTVVAELNHTGTQTLTDGACPADLDTTRFACSFGLYPGSRDTSARLIVTGLDGGASVETTRELAPHSYCARDIAYVEFTPAVDAGTWSESRYISPCSMIR